MCAPVPRSSWWLLALLLLSAHTTWAQEQPTPSTPLPLPPSTQTVPLSETPQTDPWASFDNLWSSLKTELTESDADYLKLSQSLDALLIEVQGLKSSSTELTRLWQESEAARMTEHELSEIAEAALVERMWAAERGLRAWRLAALVASGLSVVLSLIIAF